MEHTKTIKTKFDDTVTIQIECEGRPPITFRVAPNDDGIRFVKVEVFDGGCGSVADPSHFKKASV
jgi:hypothetical protein